jgi:serine/threonine protein kinase
MPFSEEGGLSEQADRIIRGAFDRAEPTWSALSHHSRTLIGGLLTVDPKLRLSCEQALCHPWLKAS